MDDGQKVTTKAHPEHSSGELKKQQNSGCFFINVIKIAFETKNTLRIRK